MVDFINETTIIGSVLGSFTDNVTGNLFFSLLLVLLLVVVLLLAFRVPFEYVAIFAFPLVLLFMAFTGEFVALGGIMLFFFAVLFVRNFFARDY